jgi:hypothetical protein
VFVTGTVQRMGPMVNIVVDTTLPEKILLAAFLLEEAGQSPFSAEALIVGSWQKYPQTFGLKGYAEQYPDSNKVLSSIMGEKGLAKRGWLVKMGQKLYALTREGRAVVRKLMQEEEKPAEASGSATSSARGATVTREQDKLLQTLFQSTALQKYQEGRKQEWTFADACRYWGITENMQGDVLDARLDHVRANLADIERQLGVGTAALSDGRAITADEISMLYDIHNQMHTRFSRHLTLLRSRSARN